MLDMVIKIHAVHSTMHYNILHPYYLVYRTSITCDNKISWSVVIKSICRIYSSLTYLHVLFSLTRIDSKFIHISHIHFVSTLDLILITRCNHIECIVVQNNIWSYLPVPDDVFSEVFRCVNIYLTSGPKTTNFRWFVKSVQGQSLLIC